MPCSLIAAPAWRGSIAFAALAVAALLGGCQGEASFAAERSLKPAMQREADGRASWRDRRIATTDINRAPPPVQPAVGGVISPSVLKPLMPPPETAGVFDVRLHPIEGVPTGVEQLVTFGVPFPRGSITQAGLARVRVLDARGAEIPAFVEQLTPWRHLSNAQLDGTSVRVARVQIRRSFTQPFPASETIRIEWGLADRTRNVATLENPRNGWQLATSGSFVAADNVFEPKVYAVLPPSMLSKGVLKLGPMRPFDAAIRETRDDPAVMDATDRWPAYDELSYASKNFFYAHINQDDPRVTGSYLIPYKAGEGEPWLYDRASAFWILYFRSGFLKALRESVRAAEFYRTKLYAPGTTPDAAVGVFSLKAPNPAGYIGSNGTMYSYGEPLAYAYWVTGDTLAGEAVKWTAKAHEDSGDEPDRWSPTSSYTERHIGIKLMSHVIAYEVFGDIPYKTGATRTYGERVRTITTNLVWHQNGAGGALPANRVDGGLWKYGSQEGNGPPGSLLVSFWQTPFVIEPMVRAFVLSDGTDIANFIRRTGNALKYGGKSYGPTQRTVYTGVNENLRLVDYVTLVDGSTYTADGAGPEHAASVAGAMAWAWYFSRLTGQPDDSLRAAVGELYRTFDLEINEWTRPTAPASGASAYRTTPPRRYNWQFKPTGSMSWAMSETRWVRN